MLLIAFPLLLLLLLAGVVWAVVRLRRRAHRGSGRELPTCGHCGYAVVGLTTFTCPECGSDLREVGIVRSRNAPPPPALASARPRPLGEFATFVRVVGWQLALFAILFTLGAYYGIDHYVERVRPTTWTETQVVRAKPNSGSYQSVTVTLTQRFVTQGFSRPPGTPVRERRADVELNTGPNRFTFVRDVINGTNTYLDAKGVEQSNKRPLSDELGAWMADHGIDTSKPAVRGEIDTIADAITQSSQQGEFWERMANRSYHYFNRDMAYSSTSPDGNAGTLTTVATALAVGLGIAGLVGIWMLNRQRLAVALGKARPVPPLEPTPHDERGPRGTPTVRTLSIMFSDVKDYTARTAGESRLGVLDLVRRHRDLAQPIVKRRGGRVVKSLGDGLLIAFESATDAVLAGLEVQAAAAAHNRDAFAERDRVELRIAVSTGEVAIDDAGDVFGETVNLASRAQQQAAAGEVLFTQATCATINRQEVRFDDAGTFDLKGMPEPVRLYRALPVVDPTSAQIA
ncbi:MAG TPA: adenylate/guanylate cyclase domain-containing protein [Tepidisphaeraceae bacterium]|jgi:class 3 adenylate cyclase/predicted RNA-binding Zn-ribbon protein involved in translation (DUF1610 family)